MILSFFKFFFAIQKILLNLHPEYVGTLAQSVEQQTENLCVPGSIPGGTTKPKPFRFGFLIL